MLLANLWDKMTVGMERNIPVNGFFLSPAEQEMARLLFGNAPGLYRFGGYQEAERKMLCYLPDYLQEDHLYGQDSPIVCLRAAFYEGDSPSHRDFLGALMACGIERAVVGDILVGSGSCDIFVTAQMAEYVCRNLHSVGRTKLELQPIPLSEVRQVDPQFEPIHDTLASLRLDSVISTGFRISRSLASRYITSGKVAVDGLPCEKPDKLIDEGMKISVRGLGKIKVHSVGGRTKKGRIWVVIHRYV